MTLRKLWFAALIAVALATVTVAFPLISHQKNAVSAGKSRDADQTASAGSGVLPSILLSKPTKPPVTVPSKPPTVKPTKKPTSRSTATPDKPQQPKTTGASEPVAGDDAAGPAVAGPCTGTVIKPGQNAQAVINSHPAGSKFCFAAGLHRVSETIRPKANMTLASDDRAVLTGSVPLTNWSKAGTHWVTSGALPAAYGKSGQCEDNSANICSLREQVFVDGTHLTRVAGAAAVKAGTFYADYAANVIHLGTDPGGRAVEMSKTRTAIESNQPGVTVRGLTIEHFASPAQAGALVSGPAWSVKANEVRWNKSVGVMLVKATNARIDRNLVHHNGQLGLGQYNSIGANVTANVISSNNTDGFWIADWESGGMKSTRSSGTVSGNLIRDNLGVGMWADVADDGRVISANKIQNNAADGIRFEISRNGVIENNTITGNGFGTGRGSGTSLWDGGGINVNTSSNVQVRNNTVTGNVNGISIQSRTRGDGPWGRYLLRNVRVTGNTVGMKGGTQSTGMVQNSGAEVPAGQLTFNGNRYLLDQLSAQRFGIFGTKLTAGGWRSAGHDTIGSFQAS
ncbi:MAG TPA: right-handed parallel beta-helix repeat-containing protein [Kribbella sp.]|uniref:right-handed parallel beta-helix repeat-containing protein n=1 Tax=Kribbella sp. TaxID=1871183 RepID=UPI002D798F27|nr:right-handed parallel beta-helix repeat-containing protein [Kribbella sp.]HET6297850.1 right-handed parallel beta-helix repeat-containing protein [Kribbella sp.]